MIGQAQIGIGRDLQIGRLRWSRHAAQSCKKHAGQTRQQAWRQDQERDDDRVLLNLSTEDLQAELALNFYFAIDWGSGAFRLFADHRRTQSCFFRIAESCPLA